VGWGERGCKEKHEGGRRSTSVWGGGAAFVCCGRRTRGAAEDGGGVGRSRMFEQHIIYGVRSVSSLGAGDSITVQVEKWINPGRIGKMEK
jgi:hypothetical protein